MRFWPFNRETRDYSSAQDELAFLQASAGGTATFDQTGLYGAIGSLYGKAFASAQLDGAMLSPSLLGAIGRQLALRGEVIVDLGEDGMDWRIPSSWTITGSDAPASWMYRLTFTGPSDQREVTRPAAGLLHLTFETTPHQAWRGVSPLAKARETAEAYANLSRHFKLEAGMAHGMLLTMPVAQAELKAAYKELANGCGKMQLFSSAQRADQSALRPVRFGSEPPDSLLELYKMLARELLAAVGIHPALVGLQESGSAVESRESWRQFIAGSVKPIGDRVQSEMSAKLETPVRLSWQSIQQADLGARARAAGILCRDLGLQPDRSLTIVGLE